MTTDQQTEVERINRGSTIRRANKKSYIINDARVILHLLTTELGIFNVEGTTAVPILGCNSCGR